MTTHPFLVRSAKGDVPAKTREDAARIAAINANYSGKPARVYELLDVVEPKAETVTA